MASATSSNGIYRDTRALDDATKTRAVLAAKEVASTTYEVFGATAASRSLISRLTSRLSPTCKARLTLSLRLAIFTLAITFGYTVTVLLELTSSNYWYRPTCTLPSCINDQIAPLPTVYYKVRRTSSAWDAY